MGLAKAALVAAGLVWGTTAGLQWNGMEYGVVRPERSNLSTPAYMVDNTGNQYGVAPDKGSMNGPMLHDHPTTKMMKAGHSKAGNLTGLDEIRRRYSSHGNLQERDGSGYWLASTTHGQMIYAGNNSYTFFRDVTAYGAVGDGVADDTAAINRAIVDGNRCGLTSDCSSTTTQGALIYFPPGTYRITAPIIQYYYTQFVGDPLDRPVIKGDANFAGIALVDTDVYIPGGNGAEWYINQNQFFRQIRNIVFDLTEMATQNVDGDQQYTPTGLHWQVAQATSLMNLDFIMPLGGDTTAVGIFMENGSGGFMSDIYFYGGLVGFKAGSQQFTHRALKFQSCITAITMIWDWGMTWQGIEVYATWIALDTTEYKGDDGQGTGSIAVVDSYFENVPYAITLQMGAVSANILLDNLRTVNCASIVLNSGGDTLLAGSSGEVVVDSWGLGNWVTGSLDNLVSFSYGYLTPTVDKSASLLDGSGAYYVRSRPQYESGYTIVNARDAGIEGDGTTDQTAAINSLLASNVGSVVFFPAGVYLVTDTVKIPVGSLVTGEGWSQIMGTGDKFADETNPYVMVQVGEEGDSGIVEISDMLFTVRGPTAGAVLMQWNVHESTQGSAAMWDSHFRVGGATGSDLTIDDCPKLDGMNSDCMAASVMLHVTPKGSGYFENVWAWVADHDIDAPLSADEDTSTATQISIYAARGILVESQGPSWFVATASEHAVLYQYQLSGANDVYLGHMQTETPYFQPSPTALQPFTIGTFAQDPEFGSCVANSSCVESWAARFINTTNVYIYSAGLYSWFSNYDQDICLSSESCQRNLVDISYSQGLWFYNIFTKGALNAITPEGGVGAVTQLDTQSGFTTEINAYLAFALEGGDIGGDSNIKGDSRTPDNVGILPLPCTTVPASSTFTMSAACTAGILDLPSSGPDASIQNDPAGTPTTCDEVCDFWRLITGTCCGQGGSIANPVEIPPGVTIPYDIALPSGFTPSFNIVIPYPGAYDPDYIWGTASWTIDSDDDSYSTPVASSTPIPPIIATTTTTSNSGVTTTTGTVTGTTNGSGSKPTGTDGTNPCVQGDCGCYPADTPLQTLVAGLKILGDTVLPGGYCHNDNSGGGGGGVGPIIIPPHPLPEDPECKGSKCRPCVDGVCGDDHESDGGDNEDPDDSCGLEVSTDVGRCDNGNFPLYDAETQTISCDYSDEEASDLMSDCQSLADETADYVIAQIQCDDQACPASSKRGMRLAARQVAAAPGTQQCPPTQPLGTPGELLAGDSSCDATFECNTDWWPNVCNNALSAQNVRGQSTVLTFQANPKHNKWVTRQWWGTHYTEGNTAEDPTGDTARANMAAPAAGWGLVGCQVEEYPFGNSQPLTQPLSDKVKWSNRATLRLVPGDENGSHGNALKQFIRRGIQQGYGDQNNGGKGFTYCVKVTGSKMDTTDYLLGKDQSMNRCGQEYGPGFLVVNDLQVTQKNYIKKNGLTGPDARMWDPWWDNHLFEHTLTSIAAGPGQAAVLVKTQWPSMYGEFPSPGLKSFVYLDGNDKNVGFWTTVGNKGNAIGAPKARQAPNKAGTNLYWDDVNTNWAASLKKKRDVEEGDIEVPSRPLLEEAAPQATATAYHHRHRLHHPHQKPHLSPSPTRTNQSAELAAMEVNDLGVPRRASLARRSSLLGGSFLDVNVYKEVLQCDVPWVDPCALDPVDCWDGGDTDSGTSPTPTPTSTATTCIPTSDPDNGVGYTWCQCPGSDARYPTMDGDDICGYTTLPSNPLPDDPWPFTYTDDAGDIIKCETSIEISFELLTATLCQGGTSTIFTATTSTTTTSTAPATTTTTSIDLSGWDDTTCSVDIPPCDGAPFILGLRYTYSTANPEGALDPDWQVYLWDNEASVAAVSMSHTGDISSVANVCDEFATTGNLDVYLWANDDGDVEYVYYDDKWYSCSDYAGNCYTFGGIVTFNWMLEGCCKDTGDCPPSGCDAPC